MIEIESQLTNREWSYMEARDYFQQFGFTLGGNWDYEALDHFLTKPKDYIKGTKMSFAGIKKPGDRADLIAYLRTLGTSSVPLPTE